jgi:hypothetical protein
MALRIRRGLESNRASMTPALVEGELAYVTDHVSAEVSALWVGSTGGMQLPVAPVLSVNSKAGTVELYTDDITESDSDTNFWFSKERAQDAAAALLLGATGPDNNLTVGTDNSGHTGITFTYNDNTGRLTASVAASGTVSTGTIGALARYGSNGTTVSPTTTLAWSETSRALTITTGEFIVTANNSGRDIISMLTAANTSTANAVTFFRARGTNESPLNSGSLDNLGILQWSAYTDTSTYAPAAQIFSNIANVAPTGGVARGLLSFATTGADGSTRARVRIDDLGRLFIGPYYSTDASISGSIILRQIESSSATPTVGFRNYFSDDNGVILRLDKFRGTFTAYTAVQTNDTLASIQARGASQSGVGGALTGVVQSSSITMTVDGTVATSRVPGAINFNVANSLGTIGRVVKINNSTSGSNGTVTITGSLQANGTISTTSTPTTFWNYDSSASTITLTLGQEITFANFSGSVLVNCHVSGTVTQYLCGGGGAPIAAGSSKVTATGTMASASGAAGYTFTATEAGIHSFYVIRTRAAA